MTSYQYFVQKITEDMRFGNFATMPRFAQNNSYSGKVPFSRIPKGQHDRYRLAGYANCGWRSEPVPLYELKP